MSAPPSSPQAEAFAATERAGRAPLVVVINPGSGRRESGDASATIEALLTQAGRELRLITVDSRGVVAASEEGAQVAVQCGGVLVAAGGDGTVNCVAQAALRHGCPMGVIALGTFNLFAREHGLPTELEPAVQALLDGRPKEVQVGLVNQHVFLANAAVGLYPKVLEDREAAKEKLGRRRRWIALASGLVSLFEWRWPLLLEVELDGVMSRVRTPSLFVCNNRLQLQDVGVDEELVRQVGHGVLAALLAAPMDAWGKLRLLARALVGRLGESREVQAIALKSLNLSMRSARKLKVATDGEVTWMELPLRFSVAPQKLVLLVPPEPPPPLAERQA